MSGDPIRDAANAGFPVHVEVIHVTSRDRRTMTATGIEQGKVLVDWPLNGCVRFTLSTGAGDSRAPSWSLTPASVERLKAARKREVVTQALGKGATEK